jgi:hypothetical protein
MLSGKDLKAVFISNGNIVLIGLKHLSKIVEVVDSNFACCALHIINISLRTTKVSLVNVTAKGIMIVAFGFTPLLRFCSITQTRFSSYLSLKLINVFGLRALASSCRNRLNNTPKMRMRNCNLV